jgi:uncharacterized protein YbbC (DUF1343 family)/CubicO group peptidase (beta-lactamase class C family)
MNPVMRSAAVALVAMGAISLLRAGEPAGRLPMATAGKEGLDSARLNGIDLVMRPALERSQLPGAVIVVVHDGKIVFRRAYGRRSLQPVAEPMTVDTVFDLASLTKPLATASSVMLPLEQGKVRLAERVGQHLPEFGQNGKERISVEQLLLHTSGLVADNPEADYADGPAKALERICRLAPVVQPGTRFTYSDVNYIVLGELVRKLSGQGLDAFATQHLYHPMGLRDTTFRPGPSLAERAAPTQQRQGRWMRGEVHDPRAFLLGGVAGHAGLFSTADDLAVFAQMFLDGGRVGSRQILSPAAVRLMTTSRPVPGGLQALGWDVNTSYSENRGELFPVGGFGHTGFTGTSLWIDPQSRTAVVFLSNRVHPDGKGNVRRLRGQIATIVAASLQVNSPQRYEPEALARGPSLTLRARIPAVNPSRQVLTGIDMLKREKFERLKGHRVGLVTNHTGLDRDGQSTIDLLHRAGGVQLVALFSPEHGIRGRLERLVADGRDEKTGLPVYSLYGERKRPTAEQLKGMDTLVYDIRDIGCRFYTYLTTLGYILETAAKHQLKVYVLDRPNPVGGLAVEGPLLDRGLESFTGYYPLPVRHGMTVGELARLFNQERRIGADLQVVPLEGWQRADTFDRTGLVWVNPSPNMRNLTAALLYPGIGLLETTNLSVGRGTDRPFEVIGAPWVEGRRLADELAKALPSGVRFVPTRFTPTASTYAGKECGGIQILIDDWSRFESLPTGLAIAYQLRRLYPEQWEVKRYLALLANRATYESLQRGDTPAQMQRFWQHDLQEFMALRKAYLLYN